MEEISEIIAGGGVVYRYDDHRLHVLIIHRRGGWDLPKGKIEAGESVKEGACREVQEETGCREIQVTGDLGSTVHYYREQGVTIKKTTWWYAMQCDHTDLQPQVEEQIDDLKWMAPEEARKQVRYTNLKEVLSRFYEQITDGADGTTVGE